MLRLQKFLAQAGAASRREAEVMIQQGRVKVNGEIVTQLGTKVDPDQDNVFLDGKRISLEEQMIYLLLNKPGGYITTVADDRGRKTVVDLLQNVSERIYPVGRLDAQTEGLLLLTNDGELAYKLTHPRFTIPKTYRVILHGRMSDAMMQLWKAGIELEDGKTAPAQLELVYARDDLSEIIVTIHEGRNRQIRRMARASGFHVYYLERIRYAFLTLDGVPRGQYRHLHDFEVQKLKRFSENA
jgi:23S rRNA pseudouridine2605 synthase